MRASRLNLQAFVEEFHEADKLMQDKPYCWILGAGTSVNSGIPAGGYFAGRWFEQIHGREKNDGESTADFAKRLPTLAAEHHIDLAGFDPVRPALHYSALYDYRFRDDAARGFAQLEEAMRGKDPGLGYSILARLLAETRHRVVITVNFDNLLSDSVGIHTDVFPLVCGQSPNGMPFCAKASPPVRRVPSLSATTRSSSIA